MNALLFIPLIIFSTLILTAILIQYWIPPVLHKLQKDNAYYIKENDRLQRINEAQSKMLNSGYIGEFDVEL